MEIEPEFVNTSSVKVWIVNLWSLRMWKFSPTLDPELVANYLNRNYIAKYLKAT